MDNNSVWIYGSEKENKESITMDFSPEYILDNNNSTYKETVVNLTSRSAAAAEGTLRVLFEQCWTKYEVIFLNTVINEYIDEGYISNSQTLFDAIKAEYGNIISSQFFNEIYIRNAGNIKIVKSLLYIMAELKLPDLHGIELGLVSFALNHNDYEVKDLALQCFEKWTEPRYLPLLSSITTGVKYLDDYLKYIIKKTGEKLLSPCI